MNIALTPILLTARQKFVAWSIHGRPGLKPACYLRKNGFKIVESLLWKIIEIMLLIVFNIPSQFYWKSNHSFLPVWWVCRFSWIFFRFLDLVIVKGSSLLFLFWFLIYQKLWCCSNIVPLLFLTANLWIVRICQKPDLVGKKCCHFFCCQFVEICIAFDPNEFSTMRDLHWCA